MQDSEKNRDVIKIPIRLWRIPFHYYQSGGGSRFYKYFDDVRALVGMWAMAHPLFENLLNKGPFKIFFSKNSLVLAHPLSKCRRGPCVRFNQNEFQYHILTFVKEVMQFLPKYRTTIL